MPHVQKRHHAANSASPISHNQTPWASLCPLPLSSMMNTDQIVLELYPEVGSTNTEVPFFLLFSLFFLLRKKKRKETLHVKLFYIKKRK
jgi:hypothetical protein